MLNFQKIKSAVIKIIGYFVLFLLIYSVMNWWRQPVMPTNPVWQLNSIDGHMVDLSKNDKPVLIYFWGSWCGVCRQTSPNVNQLAQNNYMVISIAVNSGTDDDIKQYLSKNQLSFPVVNDHDGKIFTNWQGQVTPSYVILHQGKMKQGFVGIHPTWELKLRMNLVKLI